MKNERFLADENFPAKVAAWLCERGHDVTHAAAIHQGADDANLLKLARQQDRIFLTFDRDFGELVFRKRQRPARGIVLFRLGRLSPTARRIVIRSFFESDPDLSGYFTVVSPGESRQALLRGR